MKYKREFCEKVLTLARIVNVRGEKETPMLMLDGGVGNSHVLCYDLLLITSMKDIQ